MGERFKGAAQRRAREWAQGQKAIGQTRSLIRRVVSERVQGPERDSARTALAEAVLEQGGCQAAARWLGVGPGELALWCARLGVDAAGAVT